MVQDRPFAVFAFVEGAEPESLNPARLSSLVDAIAALHAHTTGQERFRSKHRWNYTVRFCQERLRESASKSQLPDAEGKLDWLLSQLAKCDIPEGLPAGVCHCDFAPSNLLFDGDKLLALLDFDDANYTWLVYDLVNLVDYWFWNGPQSPDWDGCANVLTQYNMRRPLLEPEREHLFDIHCFQTILDCAWFFDRGDSVSFPEKLKLEYLLSVGRRKYKSALRIS
jgi:Ser/Thr protein kinase RdoA (MazF antagonist)